jgi:dienelactone hydrolase
MRCSVPRRLIPGIAFIGLLGVADAAERDPRTGERLLETATIESLAVPAPTMSGAAPVRITYPTSRGRYPIVVLSQGARSTPAMYARLAEHWAARGHVVIQPIPPELSPIAASPQNPGPSRVPATIEARMHDIRFVLGALEQIEVRSRVLKGRLDSDRIAAAGHSIGGLATLLAAGPRLVPSTGSATLSPEIDAIMLIGDPSASGIVPDGAWRTLGKPTLLATGSSDEGELPATGARPATIFTLDTSPGSAPRHELSVRGMDVCLGGLICRAAPGTTPDPAALLAVAETTSAFLRAYLKDDAKAESWLRSDAPADLANGRARLKVYP